MYMCRKSLFAQPDPEQGVAAALAERALTLVRAPRPQPALTAAILTALAAALDAAAAAPASQTKHNRLVSMMKWFLSDFIDFPMSQWVC